jgi:hypothetical protein
MVRIQSCEETAILNVVEYFSLEYKVSERLPRNAVAWAGDSSGPQEHVRR